MNIPITFAGLRHTGHACNAIPLGICTVAAWIKEHLGEYVDTSLFVSPAKLAQRFETDPPAIACFSNFMWNTELACQFALRLKQRHPGVVTIFGGPDFPIEADRQRQFLEKRPQIDFYIERAGEKPAVALIRALMERDLDVAKVKRERLSLPSCHYLVDGEHMQGELLPPLESLDDLPSPYLTGLCDDFLAAGLVPVVQTTRGCPFRCRYCQEGNEYFCKVARFSATRFRKELEYIAPRTDVPNLVSADSNFGMWPEDLAACEAIAEVQRQYDWPKFFMALEAKGDRDRVLTALRLVQGALLSAPVQSTDPTVLKHMGRRNVPWERMVEIVKSPEGMKTTAISEVILCLPGDTEEAHTKSVTDLVDAEVDVVRSHQFMMLPGAESSTTARRREYGLVTRYRVVPQTGSTYNLFGESFTAPEIDEICVANNTMSFEDYKECRCFDLTVEIFYNDRVFLELREMLKRHGVRLSTFILEVHRQVRSGSTALADVYEAFLRETCSLWESREELAELLQTPQYAGPLQAGEFGINEQTTYHAIATVRHMRELHETALAVAKKLLASSEGMTEDDWQYLDELHEYSLLCKENLVETDRSETRRFSFDFTELAAAQFSIPPSSCRCPGGVDIRFEHTKEQQELMAKYIDLYGLSGYGLGCIISNASHVSKLFRQAVRVSP